MMRSLTSVLCLSLAGAAIAQPGGGPPPAVVTFDAARMETIEQWRDVTGELRAIQRSQVASRQAGLLLQLPLNEGDQVQTGQVLARLDDTLAALEVDRSRAQVEAKKAGVGVREQELARWRRDWARYEKLEGNSSVSQTELDAARSQVSVGEASLVLARSEVAAAEAELATSLERQAQMVVKAPYAGRVVRKVAEVGQWIDVGGPVVEVVAVDRLEVRLDVPESLGARLHEGSPVRIAFRALGTEVNAQVDRIMADVDPLSRLLPVRVVLANADGTLKPGMSLIGRIASGEKAPTLTIHKDAVLRDDAGEFIYWSPAGSAIPARIRTLFAVGDRVAVSAQIPPGADVIVKGNERIMFPGQPVMDPTRPPPAAPKAPAAGGQVP